MISYLLEAAHLWWLRLKICKDEMSINYTIPSGMIICRTYYDGKGLSMRIPCLAGRHVTIYNQATHEK